MVVKRRIAWQVSMADEQFEWVEIIEPSRHEHMFANLKTGQCLWDPPAGVVVKPTHENQWWELFDTKTRRYYYYNAASQETVWYKPKDGDIIPLSKLQMLKSKEASSHSSSPRKSRNDKKSDTVATSEKVDGRGGGGKQVSGVVDIKSKARSHSSENVLNANEHVKIKDTEIISSSTHPKRTVGRTLTMEGSIGPPVKEKPKYSSLRSKTAPPKPPRSSINMLDKSGGNSSLSSSCERSVDRSLDKSEANKENEIDCSNVSVKAVKGSPSTKTKTLERPKGPPPLVPSPAPTAHRIHTTDTTTIPLSTSRSASIEEKPTDSITPPTGDYACPKSIIPAPDYDIAVSRTEGAVPHIIATTPPGGMDHAPVVKLSKSTPISPTVEYACPLKVMTAPGSSPPTVEVACPEKDAPPEVMYDTPSVEEVEHTTSKMSEVKCNEYDVPEINVDDTCDVIVASRSHESNNSSTDNDVKISFDSDCGGGGGSGAVTTTRFSEHGIKNRKNHDTWKGAEAGESIQTVVTPGSPRATGDMGGVSTYVNVEMPARQESRDQSRDHHVLNDIDSTNEETSERISQRSIDFPVIVPPVPVVPAAPPPPKVAPRRMLPSMYDNVSPGGTISMYDNSSENDDLEETFNSEDRSMSPSGYNMSGSSEEAFDPSSSVLLGNDSPDGNPYDRFDNEMDGRSATLPSPRSPRKLPIAPTDTDTPPTKRTPTLVRMKSDPIVDVEKRAKISKTINSIQSTFRPISMLNLSNNIANSKHSKRCVLGSEGDIPERPQQVPLSTHRTGILRRRMSIHSMLSWSKSCIKKPMVLTRDKGQRREAVDVFKSILICMGDKSTRRKHDDILVDIVTKGWSTPTLRDEIYIQLCKQTTCNRRIPSLKQGWELITACLSMFPPSNKFHSYLEGYISRHLDSEDEQVVQANVLQYAKYCHKQLERICQTGAKRGLKGPTLDEINVAIKRVFNPSMFGNTLDDVIEMQKERFPELRLPWILTTLTESVLKQNGLQTEGIFRVPGDIDDVNQLKLMVDQWHDPEPTSDPTVPASLLKLWFRDLYEPLIPQRFYDQCIHNCDDPEISLNIVHSLPHINYLVFSYLIRLLQAFVIPENVAMSKMDENNLAMVWAPNCLRCPSDDPREIFENTRKEMTFLRTVLKVHDTSFLEGVL